MTKTLDYIHVQRRDIELALRPRYIVAHGTQVDGRNWLSAEVSVLELRVQPAWNFVAAHKPVIVTCQLQYRHVRLEIVAVGNEVGQRCSHSSGVLCQSRGPIDTGDQHSVVEVVNAGDMNVNATGC